LLGDNIGDSLYIQALIPAVDNSKWAG